jgi:hypothetical protein
MDCKPLLAIAAFFARFPDDVYRFPRIAGLEEPCEDRSPKNSQPGVTTWAKICNRLAVRMNRCIFSSDRVYRYVLRCQCTDIAPESTADRSSRPRKRGTLHNRAAGEVGRTTKKRRIAWIGLNPSTADEFVLDQTLATVCRYSRNWGFSEVVMLNLFAFRATDPRDLKRASDPIGPDNDRHLLIEVGNVERVIACWGNHGRFLGRDRQVSDLLSVSLRCLLRNRSGAPHHPLYLKSGIRPKPFGLHQNRN